VLAKREPTALDFECLRKKWIMNEPSVCEFPKQRIQMKQEGKGHRGSARLTIRSNEKSVANDRPGREETAFTRLCFLLGLVKEIHFKV
jgi:hypothetical protein